MIPLTRRAVVGGLAAASLAPVSAVVARPADSLHERARRRGLSFGAALDAASLRDDGFRAALLQECGVIVATWEMKWGWTEPARGRYRYEAGDALAAFAQQHGLAMRGHTAVWHQNPPPWLPAALRAEGAAVLEARVREIMGRYAGRIADWDVVNEAVEPRHGRPDGLRVSPLLDALGPDYVAASFRAARAADPKARLVYNDYDLETATPSATARRRAVLALLTGLRREGLVDALGIQSHLRPDLPFDPTVFRRFLAEVAGLGLSIVLTELDVLDAKLPADVAARDAAAATYVGRYLDAALDERAVTDVVAWGLSDRYTHVNDDPNTRRPDGLRGRPLPLDEALARKPLWTAIAASLDNAPDRRRG